MSFYSDDDGSFLRIPVLSGDFLADNCLTVIDNNHECAQLNCATFRLEKSVQIVFRINDCRKLSGSSTDNDRRFLSDFEYMTSMMDHTTIECLLSNC